MCISPDNRSSHTGRHAHAIIGNKHSCWWLMLKSWSEREVLMLTTVSPKDSHRVQQWKNALVVAIKKHDAREESRICNVLGHLFEHEGQWTVAISYHQHDLEISEKIRDMKGTGIAHRNLGECYVE
jgi:uncharacterized protein HemY